MKFINYDLYMGFVSVVSRGLITAFDIEPVELHHDGIRLLLNRVLILIVNDFIKFLKEPQLMFT